MEKRGKVRLGRKKIERGFRKGEKEREGMIKWEEEMTHSTKLFGI
jgi:hypothetical protein